MGKESILGPDAVKTGEFARSEHVREGGKNA